MTRAEAKAAGLTRYSTGKSCPHGHFCERYVSSAKCIECQSLKNTKLYADNSDEYKSRVGAYKKANRSRFNELARAIYAVDPGQFRARSKRYEQSNPEMRRSCVRRHRALKRNADGDHRPADIQRLLEQQDFECNGCGCDVHDYYHVDHVIPLSRGGSNDPKNLQILCPRCNCSKGAKTMEEWKAA